MAYRLIPTGSPRESGGAALLRTACFSQQDVVKKGSAVQFRQKSLMREAVADTKQNPPSQKVQPARRKDGQAPQRLKGHAASTLLGGARSSEQRATDLPADQASKQLGIIPTSKRDLSEQMVLVGGAGGWWRQPRCLPQRTRAASSISQPCR